MKGLSCSKVPSKSKICFPSFGDWYYNLFLISLPLKSHAPQNNLIHFTGMVHMWMHLLSKQKNNQKIFVLWNSSLISTIKIKLDSLTSRELCFHPLWITCKYTWTLFHLTFDIQREKQKILMLNPTTYWTDKQTLFKKPLLRFYNKF